MTHQWRPDVLAFMRRDCCPCDKSRATVYGRGPFHLVPRRGSEDFPALDVVAEKCPAWQFATSEIREATKRIKAINEELGRNDAERSVSSLLAERDNCESQIRSWRVRLDELRGVAEAA